MKPKINTNNDIKAEFVEEEVIPVRVHLMHRGCGGEFLATGMAGPVEVDKPVSYQHQCDKCGITSVAPQSFPSIGFKSKPLIHTLNS